MGSDEGEELKLLGVDRVEKDKDEKQGAMVSVAECPVVNCQGVNAHDERVGSLEKKAATIDNRDEEFESLNEWIWQGANPEDVKKLQDARIYICSGLIMQTEQNPTRMQDTRTTVTPRASDSGSGSDIERGDSLLFSPMQSLCRASSSDVFLGSLLGHSPSASRHAKNSDAYFQLDESMRHYPLEASHRAMSPLRDNAREVFDIEAGLFNRSNGSNSVTDGCSRSFKHHVHHCNLSNIKQDELAILMENLAKRDEDEQKRQKVFDKISTGVVQLTGKSKEMANRLNDLSSNAKKILDIKVEERAKRAFEENMKKENANFLQICQSLLGEFVFFMLSLIPFLLYKNFEKEPPEWYYNLLYVVTAFALLGMFGFVLSHMARRRGWIKFVYGITAIAIMATIGLMVYISWRLIPSDSKKKDEKDMVFWIYLGGYLAGGVFLLAAWIFNFYKVTKPDLNSQEHAPDSLDNLLFFMR